MGQNQEIETTLAEIVREQLGGGFALNYFTQMHSEIGFVYFSTPAAAHIRTTGSLNFAAAEILGVDFTLENVVQLYERQGTVLTNPKTEGIGIFDQMLEDRDVIKFTFLRDPVDRFAALFRNVFSINTKETPQRKKLFTHLGISLDENLSMLDLAELLLEEKALKQLMPQFRNQRQMTAYDLVDYSFIGRHENWSEDYAAVSQEIFGRDVVQFDPIVAFNKDPEGAALQGNIDAETQSALREVYRDDYDMIEEIGELFPDGFAADF